MGFDQKDVDNLLAVTGRRCCICGGLHKIQVHHIVPKSQGGSDKIDNGISLCPNCHDDVHCDYAPGRVTRIYNSDELKLHKQRMIDQVKKESKWKPGNQE